MVGQVTMRIIKTVHRTTPNGASYTGKIYERPGFSASVVVGDPESFGIRADELMTFYPAEVKEIAIALRLLAEWMTT